MAVFEYSALNAKGKKKTGIVDADSRSAAQDMLRKQDLFPVSLNSIDSSGREGGLGFLKDMPGPTVFSRVKTAEISMVTRLIATLISAGFPLVKALATVAGQTRSKSFKKALSRIKESLDEGSSFADALALYPNLFSPVYINMVRAGEASGTLEIVLDRLADFSENREATKKKIQASLAYPFVMAIIGFIVLVILLTYIVPGIIEIFSDMNQALPLPTLILIMVSDFFTSFWWAVLAFPVLAAMAVYIMRKNEKGLYLTDRIVISIPIAGSLVQKLSAARFSRTLGSLLENGVPMLTALGITKTIAGNTVMASLIETAAQAVEQGEELGETLAGSRYFPELAAQMIKVGEKSGEMEKMLEKSADIFEKDVQSAVTAATSLLEPLVILVMGVVVGLIIMAICLPIVEINQLMV